MQQIKVPFGTGVTAPLFRYHPAIIAQTFATLESLYGPRIFLGVGTGEAMNETPLGYAWPPYSERRDRLIEAIQIMRNLWKGGFVDFAGKYYSIRAANLYLKAEVPIIMAAMGPKMAKLAGIYGDGIMIPLKPPEYIRNVLFPAMKEGADESGKSVDRILKIVGIDVAYDEDYDKAVKVMRRYAASLLQDTYTANIPDPRDIEKMGSRITDKQLAQAFPIGTNEDEFIKRISEYFRCGFDHVSIELNCFNDEKAIEFFSKKVLPHFQQP